MGRAKPAVKGARTSTHSIRCDDDVWQRARNRAAADGITVNHVLSEILEGYALGRINMPTTRIVKTYSPIIPADGEPVAIGAD